jgi:hypothetical protein
VPLDCWDVAGEGRFNIFIGAASIEGGGADRLEDVTRTSGIGVVVFLSDGERVNASSGRSNR